MTRLFDIVSALTDRVEGLNNRVSTLESAEAVRDLGLKGTDIASASTVTLGNGNFFTITGAVTINHITTTNWTLGSVVYLNFDSTPTVTDNAGAPPANTAPILLAGSANFVPTADSTLTLIRDSGEWRELSRAVR